MLMEFIQSPIGAALVASAATGLIAIVVALWRVYTLAHVNQAEIKSHKDECDKRGTEIKEKVYEIADHLHELNEHQHKTQIMVTETVAHGKQQQRTIDRVVDSVDALTDRVTELASKE